MISSTIIIWDDRCNPSEQDNVACLFSVLKPAILTEFCYGFPRLNLSYSVLNHALSNSECKYVPSYDKIVHCKGCARRP